MADTQLLAGILDGVPVYPEVRRTLTQQHIRMRLNMPLQLRPIQLALSPAVLFGLQSFTLQPVVHARPAHIESSGRFRLASAAQDKRDYALP
jgi:hypothetical protein